MRQKDGRPKTHWKNDNLEYIHYLSHYTIFFNQLEPKFGKRLNLEIAPICVSIFGRQEEYTPGIERYKSLCLAANDAEKFYLLSEDKSIIKDKNLLMSKCRDLASAFSKLLQDFRLLDKTYSAAANSELAFAAYTSACFGFSELRMGLQLLSSNDGLSEELLDDLWRGYSSEEWIKATEANLYRFPRVTEESFNEYKLNPSRPGFIPPAKDFQFINFDAWDDIEEYEAAAIDAYSAHIKSYIQNIKEKFKQHGWTRNKAEKYERVEWLVTWNKYDFKYLWEIIQYIPEFSDVDINNDLDRKRVVDNLSNAFDRFKELELPIRKPEGMEKL